MIYCIRIFLYFLVALFNSKLACEGYHHKSTSSIQFQRGRSYKSVPDWLVGDGSAESALSANTITVRFVNTPSGKDVVVQVEEGVNLLAVGDNNGIQLPRACRTGLCGSCTCAVKDPQAIATPTNPVNGYATVRACSTKCFVPDGMDEMIVDIGRMRKAKKSSPTDGDVADSAVEEDFVR